MPVRPHLTAVEGALERRGKLLLPLWVLLAFAFLLGVGLIVAAPILYLRYGRTASVSPHIENPAEHFKYGSIGSEVSSGIPYWAWQAMPRLFPEDFDARTDYSAFGFLYETDAKGRQRDLPIGVSRRRSRGVDMVWFNCSLCHTGTWRAEAGAPRHIVAGMPSNNLDFGRFVTFLLGKAATDPRMNPKRLVGAAEQAGADFGPVERQLWLNVVGPTLREGLIERSSLLMPLLVRQSAWGPGRVDTFNPYKMIQMRTPIDRLAKGERAGMADFPAVFQQRPRQGMHLHWDGNNTSLMERNLSAAIGAGVTPDTAKIDEIKRASDWLLDLRAPPSPNRPDVAAVGRGREIYQRECAACHGHQGPAGYVFQGQWLGQVTPIGEVGTDRGRLDSYTMAFRHEQLTNLFKGTPYAFRHFTKTNGYANQPLDGLWLRGPYLHNGSVPTLAALLEPLERRPRAFVRGLDIVDSRSGGFFAPPCRPGDPPLRSGARTLFCFDTRLPGNGNGGHLYGTRLSPEAKAELLAYLLTF